MIIGNGDIASVINDREDLVIFACGVSDSQCTDEKEFDREANRLLEIARYKHVVYFSSLSIYEKDTPYTKHKRYIEKYIKSLFPVYTIIRLGNITWGKNPNTIINYFKDKVSKCEKVELRDEYKYLCTEEELNYWISKIPRFSTEMNITGERISARKLYDRIYNDYFYIKVMKPPLNDKMFR